MARRGARGLGPGLGLIYEIVLLAGPDLDILVAGRAGPRSHNLICGPGRVCTTVAGPGRAWASNHICGPGLGLDFRPVQGPNVWSTYYHSPLGRYCSALCVGQRRATSGPRARSGPRRPSVRPATLLGNNIAIWPAKPQPKIAGFMSEITRRVRTNTEHFGQCRESRCKLRRSLIKYKK